MHLGREKARAPGAGEGAGVDGAIYGQVHVPAAGTQGKMTGDEGKMRKCKGGVTVPAAATHGNVRTQGFTAKPLPG